MRLLFTTLFLLNSFFLFCQTEKGGMLLNLNGNLTYFNYSFLASNKYFNGNLEAKVGYAFWDDFFIGAKYQPFYTINFSGKSHFRIPSYGIFSRYYFLKGKNRVYLQTDLNHGNIVSNFRQISWDISAGFAHFIDKHVALEIQLSRNIYYKESGEYFFADPNDPVFFSFNRPKGIDCTIGLNFFLPAQRNKIPKKERPPLNERYLKKGNKSISASGTVDFENIAYLGVFEKAKFVTDNLRMQHSLFGWGTFGNSYSNGVFEIYRPSWEWFLPITDRFYFTPLFGTGPMVNISGFIKNIDLGWTATGQVGFTHFFKNANTGLGITFNSFDFFERGQEINFSGNLYLMSEIFITDKLAIKPILYYNLLNDPTLLYFVENDRLVDVNKFRLQFGFSYYY